MNENLGSHNIWIEYFMTLYVYQRRRILFGVSEFFVSNVVVSHECEQDLTKTKETFVIEGALIKPKHYIIVSFVVLLNEC